MATAFHVWTELLLPIAEFCDNKTLCALAQINKTSYDTIHYYKRSVVKHTASKRKFYRSKLLSSKQANKTKDRVVIPEFTFPILAEIELRLRRIQSILRQDFLWTHHHAALRLKTPAMLDKFRAGLVEGFLAADELADLAACVPARAKSQDAGPTFLAWLHQQYLASNGGQFRPLADMPMRPNHRNFVHLYETSYYQTHELRRLQRERIHTFPTRVLCWLLTLAEGCAYCHGYELQEEREAKRGGGGGDGGAGEEMDRNEYLDLLAQEIASIECTLQFGTFYMFARHGSGYYSDAWAAGLAATMFDNCRTAFELYEDTGGEVLHLGKRPGSKAEPVALPQGLQMMIRTELNDRFIESKYEEAARNKTYFDEEGWSSMHTSNCMDGLIGSEIGFKLWRGYDGLRRDPPAESRPGGFFLEF